MRKTEINEYDYPATKSVGNIHEKVAASYCEIAVRDANSGGVEIKLTSHQTVGRYIVFHSASVRHRTVHHDLLHLVQNTGYRDPIDLVITSVDGDDPAWRARYARAKGEEEISTSLKKATIIAAINPMKKYATCSGPYGCMRHSCEKYI